MNTIANILLLLSLTTTALFANTFEELKALHHTQLTTSTYTLNNKGGVFVIHDQHYQLYIDSNNIVRIKAITHKQLEELPEYNNSDYSNTCSDLRNKDLTNIWPENVEILCARDRLGQPTISISKFTTESGETIIAGHQLGSGECLLLKTFGKDKQVSPFEMVDRYGNYFAFMVNDKATEADEYAAVISTYDGHMIELNQHFDSIAFHDNSIYFTKDPYSDIFCVSEEDDTHASISRVWKNKDKHEILDIHIMSSTIGDRFSLVELSDYGRSYYKAFSGEFECPFQDFYDMTGIVQLMDDVKVCNQDKSYCQDQYGSIFTLVYKEDNNSNLPQFVVREWVFSEKEDRFKTPFQINTVDNNAVRNQYISDLENILLDQNLQEILLNLSDDALIRTLRNWDYANPKKSIEQLVDAFIKDDAFQIPEALKLLICNKKNSGDLPLYYKDHLIFDLSDAVSKTLPKPFSITVQGDNGTKVPVNIWPPHIEDLSQPAPIIINIHGGPSSHEKAIFSIDKQAFASAGYWVVCPEPRGSTGYGKEHEDALINNWGKNHLDDIIAVANYCKQNLPLENNNLFLMGDSFGGYATLAMATHPHYNTVFKGYAPMAIVSNVGKNLDLCAQGPESNDPEGYLSYWNNLVGTDVSTNWNTNLENYKISPIYHMKNIQRPVRVIHGTHDNVTLPVNAIDVQYEAKRLNKPVEVFMIEGMDHYFMHEKGFETYIEKPLEFFESLRSQ